MNSPFSNMLSIRIKEFFREPEVLFWTFAFPVLLAWLLGITFSGDETRPGRVAWIENKINHAGVLEPVDFLNSELEREFTIVRVEAAEAYLMLKRGLVNVLIESDPQTREIVFRFDPRNREARLDHLRLERSLLDREFNNPPLREEHLNLQGTRYIDFLIPGLLALGIMNSALWGIGWQLIESRMRRFMRIMAATPMDKRTFFLALFLSRLLLTFMELLFIYAFAHYFFGLVIQGGYFALGLVFVAGNSAFMGLAILIASRTQNTQVGNGLINSVTLPLMLLSGIFFSYQRFPEWAAAIVSYLPLTLLSDSLRAVFNEGAGVSMVLAPALLLLLFGALTFFLGLKIFRWH